MVASTILSSAGPLRPEGAIAHQGTDVLYTISDSMNRTAILRASMPVPALYTTTEMNRESALASWGGGALVAFGEGATAGRCEVRTISDTDSVGAAIDVPVAGNVRTSVGAAIDVPVAGNVRTSRSVTSG